MNAGSKKARRYHWHSAGLASFVDDPHTAVIGNNLGLIMNLSDSGARQNRQGIVEFLSQHPDVQSKEIRRLVLDADHAVRPCHVDAKRLGAVMALALVSEIIYGGKSRFSDPARFAFAHGGKDGHPFPVPLAVYDRSIATLRHAVNAAKIEQSAKLRSLQVLGKLARAIEQNHDPFPIPTRRSRTRRGFRMHTVELR